MMIAKKEENLYGVNRKDLKKEIIQLTKHSLINTIIMITADRHVGKTLLCEELIKKYESNDNPKELSIDNLLIKNSLFSMQEDIILSIYRQILIKLLIKNNTMEDAYELIKNELNWFKQKKIKKKINEKNILAINEFVNNCNILPYITDIDFLLAYNGIEKVNVLDNCTDFDVGSIEIFNGFKSKIIFNLILTARPEEKVLKLINLIEKEKQANFEIYLRRLVPYTEKFKLENRFERLNLSDLGLQCFISNIQIFNEKKMCCSLGLVTREEYIAVGWAYAHGYIHEDLLNYIGRLENSRGYHNAIDLCESKNILWKNCSKYYAVSTFYEYSLFNEYHQDMIREMDDLYCRQFYEIYIDNYDKDIINKIISSDISNGDYVFWMNRKFTEHSKEMLNICNKLLFVGNKIKKNIPYNKCQRFSQYMTDNDFILTYYVLKASRLLTESTENTGLLYNTLFWIEKALKNKRIEDILRDEIADYLEYSVCCADRWNDLTIFEKTLDLINIFYITPHRKNVNNFLNLKVFNFSEENIRKIILERRLDNLKDCNFEKEICNMNADVLVMIATLEEEKAIIENGIWKKQSLNNGFEYYIYEENMVRFALVRGSSMGETDAVLMAQEYLSEFEVKAIAMAGFCAGARGKVKLGDIVVPDVVYGYERGKMTSKDECLKSLSVFNLKELWKQKVERMNSDWRSTVYFSQPVDLEKQKKTLLQLLVEKKSILLSELIKHKEIPDMYLVLEELLKENLVSNCMDSLVITNNGKNAYYDKLITNPEENYNYELDVVIAPLATGTKVQQRDDIFDELQMQFDRKTSALDMEGHAIAKIASLKDKPFIIAKGVADFAEKNKKRDNRYINYASDASFRFIVDFFLNHPELFT